MRLTIYGLHRSEHDPAGTASRLPELRQLHPELLRNVVGEFRWRGGRPLAAQGLTFGGTAWSFHFPKWETDPSGPDADAFDGDDRGDIPQAERRAPRFTSSALVLRAWAASVVCGEIGTPGRWTDLPYPDGAFPAPPGHAGRHRKKRYSTTTSTASPRRMSLTMVMDVAPPLTPNV